MVRTFEGNGGVNFVATTSDGKYIVSGGYGSIIELWEIRNGEKVKTFKEHSNGIINSVAITPDGKYIVIGSSDKTIKLCEIASGKEVRTFEGYSGGVNSVAITLDGKYIVSGSDDDIIKLWEIKTGKLLASYVSFKDGEWLAWKLDGDYNCSEGAEKYFCFVDDSKWLGEAVDMSHPIYKQKKKEILLTDYVAGERVIAPVDNATIVDFPKLTEIDIDEDNIPF